MNTIASSQSNSLLPSTHHSNIVHPAKGDELKINNTSNYEKLALSNSAVLGMKMVYQSVSYQYGTNPKSIEHPSIEKPEASESLFDFNKVADDVLAFVSSSIMAAKDRGASEEKLLEIFEQAKAGANLGIDQALEELEELSLLDEDLTEGIEKSRSLINEGITALQENMFPPIEDGEDKANIVNDRILNKEQAAQSISALSSEQYASNSKSSDLIITTADGDTVTINFSQIEQQASRGSYSLGEGTYKAMSASYKEINFSYSLEGELDEDEKEAIHALIEQVSALEQEFFHGDINKAYEKALTLGFDDEELAGFSLDLQQTQTFYASQKYTEVANMAEQHQLEPGQEIKQLLAFMESMRDLREKSEDILGSPQDFSELLEAVHNASFKSPAGELNHLKELFNKFAPVIKNAKV